KVTFFVGENGTGKSTLLEAIAVACGFNAEGGTRNFNFATEETHSDLCRYLTVCKGVKRPKDGFFLRAESFYNVASEIDKLDQISPLIDYYGGKSLHKQSHGESFMSLVLNRFGGNGIYILDEPEAALSPSRQMTLLAAIDSLVKDDSQFIIATHSPILMAYPDADIFVLTDDDIRLTPYEETEHYTLTKQFLNNPHKMLRYLLEDNPEQ
ncbi:MAG: AAA family ATPase, partial [Oscillospiraceae bacterium]|nr:AAA family ATPase [Oscillospiraceae bacterium]